MPKGIVENPVRVESFEEFHSRVKENHVDWRKWYYRGQSNVGYKLIPSAGRDAYSGTKNENLFRAWERHAIAYIENFDTLGEWERLAIAQHHGLVTNLMDWSFNALTAAYFALNGRSASIDSSIDCVVYAHFSDRDFIDSSSVESSPFSVDEVVRFIPRTVVPRISRQGGIFTAHSHPEQDFRDTLPAGDRIKTYIIPGKFKKKFSVELSHYGVNSLSLFPDIDGLSDHINWSFLNLKY